MANRITSEDLQAAVKMLDALMGGHGDVRLYSAYGKVRTEYAPTGADFLGTGLMSKRELYEAAHVWARGFRIAATLADKFWNQAVANG